MKSIDILGKLLAVENISIIRSNCSTASFNVETRVLTIPTWKNMTDEIETMLMSHEVGHALFTHHEKWTQVQSESNVKRDYLNVIEDVRIERLMKNKYPGIRKTFFEGYKQLHEQDFAKISKIDLDKANLIDRINLFFKFGVFLPKLKFSTEEMEFVNRAEKVVTLDEVAQLARDIYEYSKEQQKKENPEDLPEGLNTEEVCQHENGYPDEYDSENENEQQNDIESSNLTPEENSQENNSSDDCTCDESTDETEEKFDNEGSNNPQSAKKTTHGAESADESPIDESLLESITQSAMSSSLEDMIDLENLHIHWELDNELFYDPIVNYKQIISDLHELDENINSPEYDELYTKFMTDSIRVVSYLAKEFELKKSARGFQRAQTSKSGSIDCNRLFSYQINDDIFRRITTIPNEKNHGMIFLLDWSGSMISELDTTLRQLFNLVLFCRRVGIPFEVYAFSNYYNRHDVQFNREFAAFLRTKSKNKTPILYADTRLSLINFFSSQMTNLETHQMIRRLLNPQAMCYSNNRYWLGGTPLNEALMTIMNLVPKFKNTHGIEKMTLVTLTDGNGSSLNVSEYTLNDGTKIQDLRTLVHTYDDDFYMKDKLFLHHFIKDPKTHKLYPLDPRDNNTSTTQNLLKMIKDRFDIMIIGFHITRNKSRYLTDAIHANFGHFYFDRTNINQDEYIMNLKSKLTSDGVALIHDSAHDMLFFIKSNSIVEDTELNDIDKNESAAKIARKIGKVLGKKLHSRILLDKFSELSF